MATSIGPRIGVEGYNEFKTQMDTIVSKLKALENEAATLAKTYEGQENSLEYLTKKSENYSKQLELQKKGLEEASKWTQKATDYVNSKEEATSKDNLAVAKAEELESKYSAALAGTETELKKTNEAIENYDKNLLKSADAAEEIADRTSAVTVAVGNLISKLVQEAARIGKEVVQTGVEFNAQMESYRAGFTTLLGSEEEASAALNAVIADAKKAPTFSLESLVEANRTLIATGVSAEEANRQILDLANALAAAGKGDEELTRMSLNLQQIANNGQAFAIDLKQFNNAGIPVWQLLADYTGKTKDQLSDTVVTFEMLTGALQKASEEGGRYFGALDKQASTFNGQVNALKNNIRRELGTVFQGLTQTLETSVIPVLNKLFESDESVYNLVTAVESVSAAVVTLGIEAKVAGFLSSEAFTNAATKMALWDTAMKAGTVTSAEFAGATSLSEIVVGLYTGTISGATAATWAWNTAMAAAPFAAVALGVGAIVTGVRNYKAEVEKVKAENIIEPESIEEAEQHLADLQARHDELERKILEVSDMEAYNQHDKAEYEALAAAIEETTVQLDNLRAAEAARAEYENSAEGQLATITDEAKQKLTELYAAYDECYAAAFEAAKEQFGIFEQVSTSADTSTADMIAALDSQSQYWNNYSDNLAMVRDKNFGLSEDLIKALSDGSEASAGYLQSIINDVNAAGGAESEGGQAIIEKINQSYADLTAAQGSYADQTAMTATNFEQELSGIVDTAIESMEQLEMTEDMKNAAIEDMKAFVTGLETESPVLIKEAYNLGYQIAESLQQGINGVDLIFPIKFSGNKGNGVGEYATGLDYVPYDEFPAYLHKGEMVLTAAEAARYRGGDVTTTNRSSTANTVVNLYAQQIDDATVDYLYQRFNARMGANV